LATTRGYDNAGRLTSVIAPGLAAATSIYDPVTRKVTITQPNGGVVKTIRHPDGTVESVSGTGVVDRHLAYVIEGNQRKITTKVGASGSTRIQKVWIDRLGRQAKTEQPGFSATSQDAYVETFNYNITTGLLDSITRSGGDPALAPLAFTYDSIGQLTAQGIDISGGGLDAGSTDRIQGIDQIFTNSGPNSSTDWWLHRRTYGYASTGSIDSTLDESYTRLTGFSTESSTLRSETYHYDAAGRKYHTKVDVTHASASTTVTSDADGVTAATAEYLNGYLVKETGSDTLVYERDYDALGRLKKLFDPWLASNQDTEITYKPDTVWPQTVINANDRTVATYGYDTAGRRILVENEDGATTPKVYTTRMAYTTRDELYRQWGSGTYPMEYGYNDQGDRTTQNTYRSAPAEDSALWPSVGTTDLTEWDFDEPSGLLHFKKTEDDNATVFDYDDAGRLHSREWVRRKDTNNPTQGGVTSTYAYNSASDLSGITYDDNPTSTSITPAVTYT